MTSKPGLDRNGKIVEQGDFVRLLSIRPSILKKLTGSELADVVSMQNQILEVFDVYDDGLVWVSLNWIKENGTTEFHCIAVDSNSIELVRKKQASG